METKLNNIKRAIVKENKKNLSDRLQQLKDYESIEAIKSQWQINQYFTPTTLRKKWSSLKECKDYLKKRIKLSYDKSLSKELERVDTIIKAGTLISCTITVQWKSNRTWGSNPTAEADYFYLNKNNELGRNYVKGTSISGCGYDKQSTAVSEVLNMINEVLKPFYVKKNQAKHINEPNRKVFDYGIGGRTTPHISGGVGVSCYYRNFEAIGMKFETVANGKTFDVYKITNLDKKVRKHLNK